MNETTKSKATEADKASKAIFATAAERDACKPDNPNYKPAKGQLGPPVESPRLAGANVPLDEADD